MPNLQRPQRHNPLRPYVRISSSLNKAKNKLINLDYNLEQIDQSNTESSDSFSQPFQSTTDGTSTPLSSDSEGGMRAGPPRRGMSEKQDHQIYMGGYVAATLSTRSIASMLTSVSLD